MYELNYLCQIMHFSFNSATLRNITLVRKILGLFAVKLFHSEYILTPTRKFYSKYRITDQYSFSSEAHISIWFYVLSLYKFVNFL